MKKLSKCITIILDQSSRGSWKSFKLGSHFQYVAYYKEEEVGNISIFKYKKWVFINTVFVKSHYRGNGIGYELYKHCLKEFKTLSTYYHDASDDAKQVWKKLIRRHKYSTDFFKGILTIVDQ